MSTTAHLKSANETKMAALWITVASLSFWIAWWFMPGVGVTDTATIFALVGRHRERVIVSVCLQLASAAAYAPAVVSLLSTSQARQLRGLRFGAALLAIGAMGSAADAIFHLVAYEMTAPGIHTDGMVPVMQKLQGPDLILLAPMILAFFVGHAFIAGACRRLGVLGKSGWLLMGAVPLVIALGGVTKRAELVSGRSLGLTVLALVSLSLPLAVLALVRAKVQPTC